MRRCNIFVLLLVCFVTSGDALSQMALPQNTNKPSLSSANRTVQPFAGRTIRPVAATQPNAESASRTNAVNELKFNNATLEIVLNDYSEKTGRTLIMDPKAPKINITLKSQGLMTMEEYLQAIETILSMNGVALVKQGERFLKVVPVQQARKESMEVRSIDMQIPETEKDELISQLIQLKHIEAVEIEKVIKPFLHDYGQVHILERTNSILITDAAANIARVLQVLALVDLPVDALEEPHVVVIKFAKATDIKAKLEEIIADQVKDQKKSTVPRSKDSGAPGYVPAAAANVISPPGVMRPPRPAAADAAAAASTAGASVELVSEAEKGMIKGPVKIIADERTNILIILTRPENMKFFDKIIQVLDVDRQPDITVKIVRLEYAMADAVAETINTLIGGTAAAKEKDATAKPGASSSAAGADATRSSALQQYLSKLSGGPATAVAGKSKIGELAAANIKILPDKRTNALLIMASKGDLETIEEIIKNMDMQLSQVLIESVMLQVNLDDTLQSGMHWIQKALIVQDQGANGIMQPIGAVAGTMGGGSASVASSLGMTALGPWSEVGGLNMYFTHFGLNLDAILKLVKTNSKSKILGTPVVVTTDNTKASISSSQQRYFLKGSTVDQFGSVRPETEMKDIGLQLDVTPHINNKRNVMMDIVQTVSDVSGTQKVNNEDWPITKKTSFTSTITVRDKETIILGGLVSKQTTDTKSGLPILSSIPLLGRLFSSQLDTDVKSEMLAFITPYVLESAEEIYTETKRRKDTLSMNGIWEQGFSASKIADKTRSQVRAEEKAASEAEKAARRAEKAAQEAEKERLKALEIQRQLQRPRADNAAEPVPHLQGQKDGGAADAGAVSEKK